MTTLATLKHQSNTRVLTAHDNAAPAGHFIATVVNLSNTTMYLLAGDDLNDGAAKVKGVVEVTHQSANQVFTAYYGSRPSAQKIAGSGWNLREAFAHLA